MSEKKILHVVQASPDFMFWCPGCKCGHGVWTTKRSASNGIWTFNGNMEKPTFAPSLLIQGTKDITDEEHAKIMAGEKIEPKPFRCHSVVTDGVINFCGDCSHELAGRSVPMEAF